MIWGLDFSAEGQRIVQECGAPVSGAFRWLHLNLADQGTQSWIARCDFLPESVRELLLSTDSHQLALVDDGVVGCVFHDFERDFDIATTTRIGALRIALTPDIIITTRHHPLRSADIIRQKLDRGTAISGSGGALDLVVGAIAETAAGMTRELSVEVQQAEDAFLDGHHPPKTRDLIDTRRQLAQLHRMLGGMRAVLSRLEEDEELPEPLLAGVEKFVQRLHALDADIAAILSQLRLLRDELDLQATQRTNQNLYILSIMTALMLPATLITGIFGMNTGGMPWATAPWGTFSATVLALGTAATTYILLRLLGFMKQ